LALAAVISLTGCASQLEFCVVDENTNDPIAGAHATLKRFSSFSLYRSTIPEWGVGSTDDMGMVIIPGVRRKDSIYFTAPGYHGAEASFVARGKVGFGLYPPTRADTGYLEQQVASSDELIVIPLRPERNALTARTNVVPVTR
jgi:hypothetical protein